MFTYATGHTYANKELSDQDKAVQNKPEPGTNDARLGLEGQLCVPFTNLCKGKNQ
jgi:hypothetical protein